MTSQKKYKALFFILVLISMSCKTKEDMYKGAFDVQGHRGWRGLYPENNIIGMLNAQFKGVTTLEMDVVITKDHKVVLSHEPFLSHEICLDSTGKEILEKDEKSWNIYQLNFSSLQKCDCGSKIHPRFLDQKKDVSTKPLLRAVLMMTHSLAKQKNIRLPKYNIEIKSTPEGDGVYHPSVDTFVAFVLAEIKKLDLDSLCIIQSFDVRALEEVHKQNPSIKTAYLVENTQSIDENLQKLSFKPNIYSPDYALIGQKEVEYLHSKSLKVIPWTVNTPEDIQKVLLYGVDGIISDYPDRVLNQIK